MTTSDYDSESTQDRAKRIRDLLADKGDVLVTGTGTLVVPGRRGEPEASDEPSAEHHSYSVEQYLDAQGQVHVVLMDEVRAWSPETGWVTTLEILADVVV